MTLQDAMDRAIGERTLYKAAQDWDMPYETRRKYVRGGRVPDAKTALNMADDAQICAGKCQP